MFHAFRWLAAAGLALAFAPSEPTAAPLTLDSCLALTLARNPELRAARFGLAGAEARVQQAGALDPPEARWSAGKMASSLGNDDRDESVRLSQELPLFGQRGRTVRVARAERDVAATERAALELRLRGEVTRAYRRVQADVLTLRSVQELGATARDLERMVGSRLGTGGSRYLDALRARAERARLDNDAIDADRALRDDRRALNTLMALAPDAPLELADTLAFTPLAEPLDSLLAAARRTRPGIASARRAIDRENAQLALARRELWPRASISAGWDRVPGASGPGVGGEIGLTLPFAPWTDRRSKIQETVTSRDAAEARLESAERSLDSSLRTAYGAALAAGAQVERFESVLLADAHDAIRAAIQNYQAGQIEGLELFETLRTQRTVQLEHVRALLNHAIALADLEVAE